MTVISLKTGKKTDIFSVVAGSCWYENPSVIPGTQFRPLAFPDHMHLSDIYKCIVLSKIKVLDLVSARLKQML